MSQDWIGFPTLVGAAGNPNITDQLLKGTGPGGMVHNVHLDGYNILPYLTGQVAHSPRKDFLYFNDDGLLVVVRHEDWKFVFCEQREIDCRFVFATGVRNWSKAQNNMT